jgi:integrase/recombinase XerC
LAALRSLVKLANTVGLVSWRLSVESMKSQSYRDTRGPGLVTYRGMLAAAASRRPGKAARDTAILRLLQDVGLRRGELVRLDLADVDLERSAIMVTGKARTQAAPISLPALPRPPWPDGSRIVGPSPVRCSPTWIVRAKDLAG